MQGEPTTYITDNLISFYREVGRFGELKTGSFAGVPFVENKAGGWPRYLLGDDALSRHNVGKIAAAMQENQIPPFWILEYAPGNDTEALLSAAGLRRINYWTGMYQQAVSLPDPVQPALNIEIRKVSEESEMERWVELVNQVVMTSTHLDMAVFRKLLYSENFHFYGLWKGNEILSTTLIFVRNSTAGLYFVATNHAQQGKGLGTAISSYAMHEARANGVNRFVLHSTREGLQLYQRTGFRKINRYDIYWLLGNR